MTIADDLGGTSASSQGMPKNRATCDRVSTLPALLHGATDDFSYNVDSDGVRIHDLHATILRLFGIDHERLTFKYQGRYFRLTDVHGHVVKPLLG